MPREKKKQTKYQINSKEEEVSCEDIAVDELVNEEDIDFSFMMNEQEEQSRGIDIDIDKMIDAEQQKEIRIKENKKGDYSKNVIFDENPGEGEPGTRDDPDGFLEAMESGLIEEDPNGKLNEELSKELEGVATLDLNNTTELVVGVAVEVQQALFKLVDAGLLGTGIVAKEGLADKTEKYKKAYLMIYTNALQRHKKHWGIEYMEDPFYQWAALTGIIVTGHIVENKPIRKPK